MANSFIRADHSRQIPEIVRSLKGKPIYRSGIDPLLLIADLSEEEDALLRPRVPELIIGRRYRIVPSGFEQKSFNGLPSVIPKGIKDVIKQIKADKTGGMTGKGVHIAVIDTGICGTRPEFPAAKQSPLSTVAHGLKDPWVDDEGHGSMVAGIAAAAEVNGRRGVAPGAVVISCKAVEFGLEDNGQYDTELYKMYEYLISLIEAGSIGRLVINNSYALAECAAPNVKPTDPFPKIVAEAITRGAVVVFPAGNNHVELCSQNPKKCSPATIWSVNSLEKVICVGTVDEKGKMDQPSTIPGDLSHKDSSRGPGQFFTKKPDCVAPTYGEVFWDCGLDFKDSWLTSGAAGEVSGLAALLLEKKPTLTPEEVRDAILQGCVALGLGQECGGAGMIDCEAALGKV